LEVFLFGQDFAIGVVLRRFLVYYGPLVLYAVLIFVVSSIPKLPSPDIGIVFIDKIAHFLEYAVLVVLALRAFSRPPISAGGYRLYLIGMLAALVYAVADEYHQSYVPGRTADWYDVLADSLGIGCGAMVYRLMGRRRRMS
jgi:VanZ family protein